VKVPAIVSQELFDQVQERLRLNLNRYCQPATHHLLRGLLECGECGWGYSSFRRYMKKVLATGKVKVFDWRAYRCNRLAREGMHDRTRIKRCHNSTVATHILEGKVFDMIRDVMFDPAKLRRCMDESAAPDDRGTGELARIVEALKALDEKRRGVIERYATEQMPGDDYIAASRTLDGELDRLMREKAGIVMRFPQNDEFVGISIRQFCGNAQVRFEACNDFDTRRQFLVDHVERVIYNHSKVTIVGSVPVASVSGVQTKLQFRIEGQIDRSGRSKSRQPVPTEDRRSSVLVGTLSVTPSL
jgi:Recombinase zinc beta ribbon domain